MSPKVTMDISKGWKPDLLLEDIASVGGLFVAKNVLPINMNYHPMNGKYTYNTNVTSGTPLQGRYAQDTDGTNYNFLGTSTKLYRFTKAALTDITRSSGGAYTATYWSFAVYGNWLIATDFSDDPQVLKGLTTANVVALGGTPPKAKYALMNHGHLIFGYLNVSSVNYPKKIRWSARENVEDWTISLATGADEQDFPELDGVITGLAALGDRFAIFSEKSITIGEYIGGTYTFSFRINAIKNMGCFYPSSLISIGDICFFWAQDSIYMLSADGSFKEIVPDAKRTIFANINRSYANRISVAHDPNNNLIIWAWPNAQSSGNPNQLLIYNYKEDRLTTSDISTACVFTGATGGYTIDELATLKIEDLSTTLIDSSGWNANDISIIVVDTDNYIKTLTGAAVEAEVETGELVDSPTVATITKAYIPIDILSGTATVAVKHRYSPLNAQSVSTTNSVKSDSSVDLRTTNRRIALNLKVSSFTRIGRTITAEMTKSGER